MIAAPSSGRAKARDRSKRRSKTHHSPAISRNDSVALSASDFVSRTSSFSAKCGGWIFAVLGGEIVRLEAGANQP